MAKSEKDQNDPFQSTSEKLEVEIFPHIENTGKTRDKVAQQRVF